MQDVRRLLVEAMEKQKLSVEALRRKSRLECTRISLHRKLHGYRRAGRWAYQPITFNEAHKIARALDLRLDIELRAA